MTVFQRFLKELEDDMLVYYLMDFQDENYNEIDFDIKDILAEELGVREIEEQSTFMIKKLREIFRTEITAAATSVGARFFPIFTISAAELAAGYDGGGAGIVLDQGRFLPNTEQAFLTEMVEEVLSFKQLAPMSKLDLAVTTMSRRFISFCFATPVCYQPKKIIRFLNCAKTLTA